MSQTQWHPLCWPQHCLLAAAPRSLPSGSPSRGSQTCPAHRRLSCAIWKDIQREEKTDGELRMKIQLSIVGMQVEVFCSRKCICAKQNHQCMKMFYPSSEREESEGWISWNNWPIAAAKWTTTSLFPLRSVKVKLREWVARIRLQICEAISFQGLGKFYKCSSSKLHIAGETYPLHKNQKTTGRHGKA